MKTILCSRTTHSKPLLCSIGVVLALVAGILDVLSGNSVYLAGIYLLPVILIAWFAGGVSVALISSSCGIIWFAADVVSGHIYSHIEATLWEAFMVLCLFLTVGYSIAAMRMILRESDFEQQ